jgi:flagellar biosynthesis protein FliR
MGKREITFSILMVFALFFWMDVFKHFSVPEQYKSYVFAVGTILIIAAISNFYERKK